MLWASARRLNLATAKLAKSALPRSGRAGEDDGAALPGHHPPCGGLPHEETSETTNPPAFFEVGWINVDDVSTLESTSIEHYETGVAQIARDAVKDCVDSWIWDTSAEYDRTLGSGSFPVNVSRFAALLATAPTRMLSAAKRFTSAQPRPDPTPKTIAVSPAFMRASALFRSANDPKAAFLRAAGCLRPQAATTNSARGDRSAAMMRLISGLSRGGDGPWEAPRTARRPSQRAPLRARRPNARHARLRP